MVAGLQISAPRLFPQCQLDSMLDYKAPAPDFTAIVRVEVGVGQWWDTTSKLRLDPEWDQRSQRLWASLVAQLVKNLPAMQETPGSIPRMGRAAGEGVGYPLQYSWATLVTQLVKNPPAVWEVWARSLGWEDPLEKASILAWRIPWTRIHGVANNRTRPSDFSLSFRDSTPPPPTPPCDRSSTPDLSTASTRGGGLSRLVQEATSQGPRKLS